MLLSMGQRVSAAAKKNRQKSAGTGKMKKEKIFSEKCLQFEKRSDIIIKPKGHGRLAQLVEHLLDVQRVRDSSSLPSTTQGAQSSVLFFVL